VVAFASNSFLQRLRDWKGEANRKKDLFTDTISNNEIQYCKKKKITSDIKIYKDAMFKKTKQRTTIKKNSTNKTHALNQQTGV
jgi:hypothetical protein